MPSAALDRVTVTVSPWPVSGSVTVTAENGLIVARSPTCWFACAPPMAGVSLTLVTVVVSEAAPVWPRPLVIAVVKVVETVCVGATSLAVGVKVSACRALSSASTDVACSV